MNNCSFIGRLVHTPNVQKIQSGDNEVEVCNFSIAVHSAAPIKGQEKDALFFDCKAWRGQAQFLEGNFSKGQNVGVTGELRYDVYEKEDRKQRRNYITVRQISFCESKGKAAEPSTSEEDFIFHYVALASSERRLRSRRAV